MNNVSIAPNAASDFAALIALGQSVLDAMPAGVYICASDGKILRHNRRAAEFWGRTPRPGDTDERFCGAFRLYHLNGRSQPHAETPMQTVLRSGEPAHDIEVIIDRPDGSRVTALAAIEPLFDRNGKIEGAINCLQDITDRKASEDRLKASESRSRALLEALPAAVYTTDAEGKITFFNEAAAQLWGHRPTLGESEWCGSWQIFEPDGTPLPHDQCPMAIALKEDRAIRNVEAIAERPDGTRVPFAPYPTPLHDSSGGLTGAINMLVDISYHKDAEARQRLLNNELNHRVKNSLATAQSIVAISLRRADDLDTARRTVEERLTALARAHDLLTETSWRSVNLENIVRSSLAGHCGDAVHFRIEGPDLLLTPKTSLALAMALHELCTNAVKYGSLSTAGGEVSVTWRTEDRAGSPHLELDWLESGGPVVKAPARRGFGFRLLEMGLVGELGGKTTLSFRASGLECHMDIPLAHAV